MMRLLGLVFALLACTGHGQEAQSISEGAQSGNIVSSHSCAQRRSSTGGATPKDTVGVLSAFAGFVRALNQPTSLNQFGRSAHASARRPTCGALRANVLNMKARVDSRVPLPVSSGTVPTSKTEIYRTKLANSLTSIKKLSAKGWLSSQILLADALNICKLIGKSATGRKLTERQVKLVRRFFKDVLTLIPTVIIAIIPIGPILHVLVYGFIARYWPGFFPSFFSEKRLNLRRKRNLVKMRRQLQQQFNEVQTLVGPVQDSYRIKLANSWASVKKLSAKGGLSSQILFADMLNIFKLIGKAVTGRKLTQRQVKLVRRFFKDVLTLIPTVIIAIIPIGPILHVLVYGSIARYWPGFFPSFFSEKRLNLRRKRNLLKMRRQLQQQFDEVQALAGPVQDMNGVNIPSTARQFA